MLNITINREMLIKTTIRYRLTPVRMVIIKKSTNNKCGGGCEKRESFCTGGIVNWSSHYGNQYRGSKKKLKMELPHDQAISLVAIY